MACRKSGGFGLYHVLRPETTVALGTGIEDGELLYCHEVAEVNADKKISTLDYNNRTFYECLYNSFIEECGSPDLNLPPNTIDNIPRLHKIDHYTLDLIPDSISVASGSSLLVCLSLITYQIFFLLMIIILYMS